MIPKKPLREIMLDAHEDEVKSIYGIPKSRRLHYNHESTQICVESIPIFSYLSDRIFDPGYTREIVEIRQERRQKIIDAHSQPQKYSSEKIFHLQFDYELLAIDHLVDTELACKMAGNLDSDIDRICAKNYFLIPSSGKTFFEEVHLKELESCGFQLLEARKDSSEKDFFFENKGFDYFLRHTMTRDKLIRIIMDYDSVLSRMKKRYDSLIKYNSQMESPSEIYDRIKDIRMDQMRRRCARLSLSSKLGAKEQDYISFIGNALDFNEDNRLLRSISFYYIMKDRQIGENFCRLIESRKNGNR